jgi:hypothetical protein
MLEPYEGKLSRTVLRGKGAATPLTYPVRAWDTYGGQNMKVAIDLGEVQLERLRNEAARLGVPIEELARAAVNDLLAVPSEDFEQVTTRVLEKNKELYERLS